MLTPSEILDRLRDHDETVQVEAKRGTEIGTSVIETVSAFSNEPGAGGGYLLFGVQKVSDSLFDVDAVTAYEVAGVDDPDKLQADLATQCRTRLTPPVRPEMAVAKVEGRTLVAAFVPEADPTDKPVFIEASGLPKGAFRRIGSTDQRCTEDDIAALYAARGHATLDNQPFPGAGFDVFDTAAVAEYRRARGVVNPGAAELGLDDSELLHALACYDKNDGTSTLAGLILFGSPGALRRHFPSARVDYIRVPGREWVPDPEKRYESVEFRAPLLTLIPRVVAAVLDDVPKAFTLTGGDLHRREEPVVPRIVLREAIVNALMHRSYRLRQPVQIIRYANRLEIRTPGHSLVPDDRLGEPGSLTRNEKIAAVLHEVGLAETKGTGIRVMRQLMNDANLPAPLFESDRRRDSFTVTLLMHHLATEEDIVWLSHFHEASLSEDEVKALIVVREVGAINNSAYRDISGMDTLTASSHLRRLRDLGLLEQKGRGSATYYVPTPQLLDPEDDWSRKPSRVASSLDEKEVDSDDLATTLDEKRQEQWQDLEEIARPARESRKLAKERLNALIVRLCAIVPLSVTELSRLLERDQNYLRSRLRPLVKAGTLRYSNPDAPSSPHQRYLAPRRLPADSLGEKMLLVLARRILGQGWHVVSGEGNGFEVIPPEGSEASQSFEVPTEWIAEGNWSRVAEHLKSRAEGQS